MHLRDLARIFAKTPEETFQGDGGKELEAFESQLICGHVCRIVCYLAKLPLKQIIASSQ